MPRPVHKKVLGDWKIWEAGFHNYPGFVADDLKHFAERIRRMNSMQKVSVMIKVEQRRTLKDKKK